VLKKEGIFEKEAREVRVPFLYEIMVVIGAVATFMFIVFINATLWIPVIAFMLGRVFKAK